MINKNSFTSSLKKQYEHAKKYAKLISSNPKDLVITHDKETVIFLIEKSQKISTLNLKSEGEYYKVQIRNMSGYYFAFYEELNSIIIDSNNLEKI